MPQGNGGVVGPANDPTTSTASGVWGLKEHAEAVGAGEWPSIIPPNISRSLRFDSTDSSYLSRTFGVNGSQRKTTFSCWLKKGRNGLGSTSPTQAANQNMIMGFGATSANDFILLFQNDDTLLFVARNSSSTVAQLQTNAVYRDNASWMHIVLSVDSTAATESDRVKIYVNGSQVTSFSTETYPTQNLDFAALNNTTYTGYIGNSRGDTTGYFNGYMTQITHIDGEALPATDFGLINPSTFKWVPRAYPGASYPDNSYLLNFADNTSTTTIGYDVSGNSNNWTANNFSVTAGVDNDSLFDSPTDYEEAGVVHGNWATLNPNNRFSTDASLSDGNLVVSTIGSGLDRSGSVTGTIAADSGKWYFEVKYQSASLAAYLNVGAFKSDSASLFNANSTSVLYYSANGQKYINGASGVSYGATWTVGSVIGVALDMDAGTITFYKDGVSQGVALTGLTGFWYPAVGYIHGVADCNFGQRPWYYNPPSGFHGWSTYYLPDPTVVQGDDYFNTVIWTGTDVSAGRSITGVGFAPDFVWSKPRSLAYQHNLYDAVRGVGKRLQSNATDAESTNVVSGYISSFDSDGFTTTAGATDNSNFNDTGDTYVAWNWNAGGSNATNTDGTITSTVRANPTAGFSIITYTGTGSTATVGHGLGVAPSMIITKSRTAGTQEWAVFHQSLSAGYSLFLNTTAAQSSRPQDYTTTLPTSSVYSIGTGNPTNQSSQSFVAYCFAEVPGFSAFGKYTGNGSANGPFVYTGFRPAFVLFKSASDGTRNWHMNDAVRNAFNAVNFSLQPNQSSAESTSNDVDYLSNGFKLRSNQTNTNASGGTYIYAAFAENPFKYALAR